MLDLSKAHNFALTILLENLQRDKTHTEVDISTMKYGTVELRDAKFRLYIINEMLNDIQAECQAFRRNDPYMDEEAATLAANGGRYVKVK